MLLFSFLLFDSKYVHKTKFLAAMINEWIDRYTSFFSQRSRRSTSIYLISFGLDLFDDIIPVNCSRAIIIIMKETFHKKVSFTSQDMELGGIQNRTPQRRRGIDQRVRFLCKLYNKQGSLDEEIGKKGWKKNQRNQKAASRAIN